MFLTLLAQAEPDVNQIAQAVDLFDFTKITIAAVVIGLGFLVNRAALATLDRMGEGQAKRRLLFKKVQSFTRLGIFIVCGYLLVMTFFGGDGDNKALIGLGGTLAVAIGFALKDTASSLMSGILILIDQPFQVGDRVAFGDTYGEVKEIGLRSVRIVTLDDNEVSIPNNKFLTEAVASANSGALDMMVVIKFHIAVTEDFELAKRLVYEACVTSKYVFLHKPVVINVKDEVTAITYATTISAKAYVIDARYETAFITDVTERVKRAFREHQIYYPYGREYQVLGIDWDEDREGHSHAKPRFDSESE
jgi:small-conductance mechanosensitive channel